MRRFVPFARFGRHLSIQLGLRCRLLLGVASILGVGCHPMGSRGPSPSESRPAIFKDDSVAIDPALAGATVWVRTIATHGDPPRPHYVGDCTGVLIAPAVVLTTAHCVPPGQKVLVFVPTRSPSTLEPRSVIRIRYMDPEKRSSPPDFAHDLVKLTLDGPLDPRLSRAVPLADVSDAHVRMIIAHQNAPAMGFEFLALGRGSHKGDVEKNGQLKAARTTLVDGTFYFAHQKLPLIAVDAVTDAGDSGGPLYLKDEKGRWVLLGLLHGYLEHCEQKRPLSLYTVIPDVMEFLREK